MQLFSMRKYLLVCIILIASISTLRAQDPQYSQFYAAPLYLNPAFAGSALSSRAIFNYRNQWPGLNATFVTYSASFDHYFPKIKSGVGILATNDTQGFGKLRSTDIGAQYAYQLELTDTWAFRVGFQGSYVSRSIDFSNLIFSDQLSSNGPTGGASGEESYLDNTQKSYADVSTGGLVYSDMFYIGYSAHHVNRPSQSFIKNADSRLPMKSTITAGMTISLDGKPKRGLKRSKNEREVSISPALLYKMQGKFSQLDAGMYFTYEPAVFGLWYRGIPIKKSIEGLNNHDAVIFLAGFRNNNFSFGYSYDLTISSLTPSTGGAHEVSVSYVFPRANKKKKLPRSARRLPCPKF